MNSFTSISTVPPEILAEIASHLSLKDLGCLLQTSRYIYNITYPRLRDESNKEVATLLRVLQDNNRFTTLQDDYLSLRFSISEVTESQAVVRKCTTIEELLQALEGNLSREESRIHIYRFAFITHYSIYVGATISELRTVEVLCRMIKLYSQCRPAAEFSISSAEIFMAPSKILECFDALKLSKLHCHLPPSREGRQSVSTMILEKPSWIVDLAKLLRQAHNLASLKIFTHWPPGVPVGPLSESIAILNNLADSFANLKLLKTLSLTCYLFHPKYFLPIPENVEKLYFYGAEACWRAWWYGFAKSTFKNVRELGLILEPRCWRPSQRDDDEVESVKDCIDAPDSTSGNPHSRMAFYIKDVEVHGLKKFSYPVPTSRYIPKDLVECIMNRNKALIPE